MIDKKNKKTKGMNKMYKDGKISNYNQDVIIITEITNQNKNQEIKQDDGKIDYTLLDWGAIRKLVEVREYGVKKYNKRDSWQEVSKERYIKALLRHVIAYADREENDKESGLNHLAHAMCNCMFILSGKLKEGKK
jgi:hypothetical protein